MGEKRYSAKETASPSTSLDPAIAGLDYLSNDRTL